MKPKFINQSIPLIGWHPAKLWKVYILLSCNSLELGPNSRYCSVLQWPRPSLNCLACGLGPVHSVCPFISNLDNWATAAIAKCFYPIKWQIQSCKQTHFSSITTIFIDIFFQGIGAIISLESNATLLFCNKTDILSLIEKK